MKDIGTTGIGGDDYYYESKQFDGGGRQPRKRQDPKQPVQSDLTRYRFCGRILTPSEERDLLRRAQAGDGAAKNELVSRFHRSVLEIAGQYHGPAHEDLVAAGLLGLCEAIAKFDLRRKNGFFAYAKWLIREEIREAAKEWRKRGQAGETRADRYVYDNPNATPDDIAKKVGCSVSDAGAATQRAEAYRNGHERYDTTENGAYDEDDNCRGQRRATAHEIYSLYDFYSPQQLSPQLRFHGAVSRLIDALAVDADKRAARRLKQIGRRAYALELVERDRKRIAARADEQQYLYPWKRWKAKPVAAPQPHRKRKQKVERRRPPIRSWRSDENTAAIAAI
jgi:RNA polymerase sigma factor (sigma-70 family)